MNVQNRIVCLLNQIHLQYPNQILLVFSFQAHYLRLLLPIGEDLYENICETQNIKDWVHYLYSHDYPKEEILSLSAL
jgi:hypothetical protein